MTKVRVERELCIGSGYCVRIAPRVFELDKEGLAVVTDSDAVDRGTLDQAADTCPAGAIYLDPAEEHEGR